MSLVSNICFFCHKHFIASFSYERNNFVCPKCHERQKREQTIGHLEPVRKEVIDAISSNRT